MLNQDYVSRVVKAMQVIDSLSSNYLVANIDPEVARAIVGALEGYNNFTQEDLVRLVDGVNAAVPLTYFNEGNPNNGSFAHNFRIGNENSRVIYVAMKGYRLRAKNNLAELYRKLEAQFSVFHADEHDVVYEGGDLIYRFWFD